MLYNDYRPTTLDEVIGQAAAVRSLQGLIKRNRTQAWLLTGPSGVGKTTLARIVAKAVGCRKDAVREVDAATENGIDDVRKLQSEIQYVSFSGSKARALLIDEAHALSPAAWKALLKITEEPPPGVHWFLCTTEPAKVPPTIKTRFVQVALQSVTDSDLYGLLEYVCAKEKIDLPQDVEKVIVKEALGSPRQLLVNLEAAQDARNGKEAAEMLQSATESDMTRELCRALIEPGMRWEKAVALVSKMDKEKPESVRIVVCNYVAAVLAKQSNEKRAKWLLHVLDAFEGQFNDSEKKAPLLLALGRVCMGD